jgi:hypothetical protein
MQNVIIEKLAGLYGSNDFESRSRRRDAARYRGGWATPTMAIASLSIRRKKMGFWPVSIQLSLVVTRKMLRIRFRVTLKRKS